MADLDQKYPYVPLMHRIKPQPELDSNFHRILFVILVENILIFMNHTFKMLKNFMLILKRDYLTTV